ncbi:MAG: ABC transporter ATP-binding protein, partial [Acidobacteria bacterium RIFCSPLOWO2_02_FULL_59_13]
MNALLRVEGLTKIFRSGESDLVVLEKLQLTAEAGEMVAIVGESGSGKSTLLHIVGALDKPTEGELYFDERAYSQMSAGEKEHLRNREIGFVWQLHFLLPEFTAQENVMMPLLIQGLEKREAKRRAGQWLARIGLQGRLTHRAGELSGGEQQRGALARA